MEESIKILFVEDVPSDAELIWREISKARIRFTKVLVDNKKDYLAALQSFGPDLIVSDFSLPQFDGMSALFMRNELAAQIPFILVTGSVNEEVAVECMRKGADDYIIKQNLSRLGEAIKSTMVKKRLIRQKEIAEKLLQQSEEKYRLLVDASPDSIVTVDMNWDITYASLQTFKMFRVPEGFNVIGMSLFSWVSPDYLHIVTERVTGIINGNLVAETKEYKLLRFDKTTFWGEISSSTLKDKAGDRTGLLIVCRDVTDRKKGEEDLIMARDKAEESDRLKSAFIHNISHEIRNPMNAIIGFSALLSEPNLDAESQRSFIDFITQSSNRLLAVVNDIIEISNIEAGVLKLLKNEINVNITANKLLNQFRPLAEEKGLTFTCDSLLPDNESYIKADYVKLTEVISKLLSNAFKFTMKGKVTFGFELKNNLLEFHVSDTGIGINKAHHKRIFERFYQVESAMDRKFEGTGLGLSIAKAYVELMGGSISLQSEPEKGSVFYFSIPYNKVEKPYEKKERRPLQVISRKLMF